MRILKYLILCIMVVVLFVCGGFFTYFILAPKEIFGLKQKNDMFIQRMIAIQKEIQYQEYIGNIELSVQNALAIKSELSQQEQSGVERLLKDVLERAKKDEFCKKGSFVLMPTFDYKDGQKVQKGHKIQGSLECKITQQELEKYNELLKDLDYIAMKSGYASLWASALSPSINDEQINTTQEKAYDELLMQAQNLATHYTQISQKSCKLTELNLANSNSNAPIMAKSMLTSYSNASNVALSFDSAGATSELPLDKATTIYINARASFICK